MATTVLDLLNTIVTGIFDLLKSPLFWAAVAIGLVALGVVQREALVGILKEGAEVIRSLR